MQEIGFSAAIQNIGAFIESLEASSGTQEQ